MSGPEAGASGLQTIALTGGDGGLVGLASDARVIVGSDSRAGVQQARRARLEAIGDLIERGLFP